MDPINKTNLIPPFRHHLEFNYISTVFIKAALKETAENMV